jgi:glycosyltransferase involved in cell wall biosynthesis
VDNNRDLLIITHESVGDKMAGPGIRYWEMARALGSQGARITLATPLPSTRVAEGVEIKKFIWEDPSSISSLINKHPVILSNGPVIARVLHLLGSAIDKPTIVDIYYSPEIEQMMLNITKNRPSSALDSAALDDLHTYLRQGDLFTCAFERQYDFWLGAMLAVGRLNTETVSLDLSMDGLLKIVPMGFPDNPPEKEDNLIKGVVPGISTDDKVIYWGGGIWDWTDPLTLLEAFKVVLQHRDDVRLVFGALHHYEQTIVPEMSVAGRLMEFVRNENWLDKYVFFLDWIPYDDRGSYLLEVDLGASLTLDTIENRYAARARLMDCMWAVLPCVTNEGDDIGDKLSQVGLARLVPYQDTSATASAILEILSNAELRNNAKQWIDPLRSKLNWSGVVQPLLQYLQNPIFAPDATRARETLNYNLPLRKEWEDIRAENVSLNHQLEMFQQRKIVRFANTINKILNRG